MLHKGFIESQSDYGTVTPSHKSGTNTLRKGPCARNSDTLILNVSKQKGVSSYEKCVIYARYSSERQTEQSIEGQLRVCQEFAKNNDILIVDTYIDRAMTGTNDNRKDFQQMLSDSEKPRNVKFALFMHLTVSGEIQSSRL